MKQFVIAVILAGSCAAIFAASAAGSDGEQPPRLYTYEEVPVPAGFHSITLTAINDLGDTAGVVQRHYRHPDYFIIVRHPDGSRTPVPIPLGATRQSEVAVVALNQDGQMLAHVRLGGYDDSLEFYDPRHGWTLVQTNECTPEPKAAMNNHGDVVGTCSGSQNRDEAFVWNRRAHRSTVQRLGRTTTFNAINDDGQIAATIVRPEEIRRPGERHDQTAALVSDARAPKLVGDLVVHDPASYEDPANADHVVWSSAGAVSADGTLGVSVQDGVDARGRTDYRACAWTAETGLRCSIATTDIPTLVGFGPEDALFYNVEERRHARGYLFLPRQATAYSLAEVTSQSNAVYPLGARGVNKVGEVVGTPSNRRNRISFILHPVHAEETR